MYQMQFCSPTTCPIHYTLLACSNDPRNLRNYHLTTRLIIQKAIWRNNTVTTFPKWTFGPNLGYFCQITVGFDTHCHTCEGQMWPKGPEKILSPFQVDNWHLCQSRTKKIAHLGQTCLHTDAKWSILFCILGQNFQKLTDLCVQKLLLCERFAAMTTRSAASGVISFHFQIRQMHKDTTRGLQRCKVSLKEQCFKLKWPVSLSPAKLNEVLTKRR